MNAVTWLIQVLEVLIAVLAAPLFAGWIAQCRAVLQNRTPPSIWLPYRNIRKLLIKEAVLAEHASPLFRAAPYIVCGTMICAAAIVPSTGTNLPFSNAADAIALVGLLATARVFMALAAMDVGTAFGTLGARREMMVGFLAEPALLIVIFVAALISQSTALPTIAERLATDSFMLHPSLAFTAVAFGLVLLAENARLPVDNPATHLELTMIHEVMVLDHSGPAVGLIHYGAAVKFFAMTSIIARLVVPVSTESVLLDWGAFVAAMLGLAIVVGVVESVMARLQLVLVPNLLIGAGMLTGLALVLLFMG